MSALPGPGRTAQVRILNRCPRTLGAAEGWPTNPKARLGGRRIRLDRCRGPERSRPSRSADVGPIQLDKHLLLVRAQGRIMSHHGLEAGSVARRRRAWVKPCRLEEEGCRRLQCLGEGNDPVPPQAGAPLPSFDLGITALECGLPAPLRAAAGKAIAYAALSLGGIDAVAALIWVARRRDGPRIHLRGHRVQGDVVRSRAGSAVARGGAARTFLVRFLDARLALSGPSLGAVLLDQADVVASLVTLYPFDTTRTNHRDQGRQRPSGSTTGPSTSIVRFCGASRARHPQACHEIGA